MKTTVKGLTSYQRRQIVFIATTEQYSEKERVELLRSLSYCTNIVKLAVLKEELSTTLYKRLARLYASARRKQWTYEDTVRLIDCYNSRKTTKEMMLMFGTSEASINGRICYLRSHPRYKNLFTLKKYNRRAEVKA